MVTFQVGRRELRIAVSNKRWTATLDGLPVPGWFTNQAEAWAAGVREADRLEHAAVHDPLPAALATEFATDCADLVP